MSIKDELIAYKTGGNPLKEKFLVFIKDKSVPLDERWDAFREAPIEFLEHDNWIHHFEAEKLLDEKDISWYDDFGIERGNTVSMIDFIEDMLPNAIENDDDKFPVIILDAFKEEVMQAALGSFDFDW